MFKSSCAKTHREGFIPLKCDALLFTQISITTRPSQQSSLGEFDDIDLTMSEQKYRQQGKRCKNSWFRVVSIRL